MLYFIRDIRPENGGVHSLDFYEVNIAASTLKNHILTLIQHTDRDYMFMYWTLYT